MITTIKLENFKLHESTKLECKPLTVFIGPNNSGKSSIFQALLCLKQASLWNNHWLVRDPRNATLEKIYYGQNVLVDLGEFKDVVRSGKDRVGITLGGKISSGVKNVQELAVEIEQRFTNNAFSFSRGSLQIPDSASIKNFNNYTKKLTWDAVLKVDQKAGEFGMIQVLNNKAEPLKFTLGRFEFVYNISVSGISAAGRGYHAEGSENPTSEMIQEAESIASALFSSTERLIRSVRHVYALRGIEESAFPLPASKTDRLENVHLSERTSALIAEIFYDEGIREKISQWMHEILGLKISCKPIQGPKVLMEVRNSDSEEGGLLVNQGTGSQQLPFLFVPIALAPPGESILLSEPEAHLHPQMQALVAQKFIDIYKKEQKQFFIETHSEHILHAFLYAIAKKELTPDQLRIYYFMNDNGVAKVNEVKVDEHGRVEGGLPGFFDHSLKELSDYLDALADE